MHKFPHSVSLVISLSISNSLSLCFTLSDSVWELFHGAANSSDGLELGICFAAGNLFILHSFCHFCADLNKFKLIFGKLNSILNWTGDLLLSLRLCLQQICATINVHLCQSFTNWILQIFE